MFTWASAAPAQSTSALAMTELGPRVYKEFSGTTDTLGLADTEMEHTGPEDKDHIRPEHKDHEHHIGAEEKDHIGPEDKDTLELL